MSALRLASPTEPSGEPEREHVKLRREHGIAGRVAEGAHEGGDRRERRLVDDLAESGDVAGCERLLALMGRSLPACSLAHGASCLHTPAGFFKRRRSHPHTSSSKPYGERGGE